MLAVLGASGCGKSMTLKCIAGIEKPDRGRIVLNNTVLFDSEQKINLKPQKRKAGYLFQQYALFPNMTALQNVMCGVREGNREEKRQKALLMLDRLHLSGQEEKKPSMLSGGQQQRCALARILVNEPEVLLLDEPFSALDAHLRFHTERQVETIIKEFQKPVVFVSHDRDEVFRLTDNIAVMEKGKIHAMGEKHEVFSEPETIGGAILTGCKNISEATVRAPHRIYAQDWGIELEVTEIPENFAGVGIRMHDVLILDFLTEENSQDASLKGTFSQRRADASKNTEIRTDAIKNAGINVFHCRVIGKIENPFSYSIMMRPVQEPGDRYILVEMRKALWEKKQAEFLDIYLPPEKILLLK
ncbi:MAG: ATP-binding cassette domain-containing protein [Parasporobacterium sp.]|nr:ATP-binding cassette domain-containing protein [Parasporobacterium sp.]